MRWKKIRGKQIHKNRWFSLWEDDVIRPDKSKGKYFVIKKESTSIIIPFSKNKIYLVNQFRYPILRRSWELPMGTFEKDKSNLLLAKRELKEETGFTANKLKYLGEFSWMNGMSNQMAKVYLASDLVPGKAEREGSEKDMKMKAFTVKQLENMIAKGQIIDSGTIVALYQFRLMRKI